MNDLIDPVRMQIIAVTEVLEPAIRQMHIIQLNDIACTQAWAETTSATVLADAQFR